MLREHRCPYCKQIFMYDDGVGASPEANIARLPAYCPVCVDPNALAGFTYYKESILRAYGYYLENNGIITSVIDRHSLLDMMFSQFPATQKVWTATTYRTFTLYDQLPFPNGLFRVGTCYNRIRPFGNYMRTYTYRKIHCNRCERISSASKVGTLWYFFWFKPKYCFNCEPEQVGRSFITDETRWMKGNPNPTFGGKRHLGGVKSDTSLRARAKQLNVSVNDLRRGITESDPILSNGTVVNGLTIVKSYWDDRKNVYEPRYLLECQKCQQKFAIAQKRVYTLDHRCQS